MDESQINRLRPFHLLLLLGIVALGAFLRLFQLDSLPPGDGYDVAQYGLDALQILDGARPLFLAANFGREALFSYLVAIVYLFTGPGALGIHLSSALIGIATIPAVYWAARELLAEAGEAVQARAPLLAAAVTAVSYWHLNYSRAGLRVIWVPLFAALITAALWRGLRLNNRFWLAAAGILLGLSQYTYQAARLLPLLVLAAFFYTFASARSFTRDDLLDLLVTFGLALLVFAPLGLFAVRQPDVFNDRLRQTALLDDAAVLEEQLAAVGEQAVVTLRMFFIEGDQEPLYTIPGRPSLNPFLAAALGAGILGTIWRWRRAEALYLLTGLLLLSAPAMIADQAATAKRALGAFPAVAILSALGLALPYLLLGGRRSLAAVYGLLIAVGLLLTAAATYNDYFLRWGANPALAAHFERDHTVVGLAAAQVPEKAVLISPFPAGHPAIQLNSGRHPNLRSYDGHRCLLIPEEVGGMRYIVVPGETETSIAQLQEIFPGVEPGQGARRAGSGEVYYETFDVPPGAEPALAAEAAPLLNWQDEIGLLGAELPTAAASPGETVHLTLTYRALADPGGEYTAFVHLLSRGEAPQLAGQADSEPCGGALRTSAWRQGDIVRDTIQFTVSEETPPGLYDLQTGFYTWPDIVPLALAGESQGKLGTLEIR